MNFLQILILGLVEGAAELLPVSSSAHVIVAELMGCDPSSPEMTFLLVMLHTGTMFAVIVYFWNSWLAHYCSDAVRLGETVKNILAASVVTLIVGLILKWVIEKIVLHGHAKARDRGSFFVSSADWRGVAGGGVAYYFFGIERGEATGQGWRRRDEGFCDRCGAGALPAIPRLFPLGGRLPDFCSASSGGKSRNSALRWLWCHSRRRGHGIVAPG